MAASYRAASGSGSGVAGTASSWAEEAASGISVVSAAYSGVLAISDVPKVTGSEAETGVLSVGLPQAESRAMQPETSRIANSFCFKRITSFQWIDTEYHVQTQKATGPSFFRRPGRKNRKPPRGLQEIMLLHCVRKNLAKKRFFSENAIDLGEKLQYNDLRNSNGAVRIPTPHSASVFISEKNSPAEIMSKGVDHSGSKH
jgi:hypothetical protein